MVGEFRLDNDGRHHYYDWPEDPKPPFRFTPEGTDVDDLVYESLGSGGLSMALSEVTILGSVLTGSVALHDNTQVPADTWTGQDGHGPVMAGSSVHGSLACSGNSQVVTDFGTANDVTGSVSGDRSSL